MHVSAIIHDFSSSIKKPRPVKGRGFIRGTTFVGSPLRIVQVNGENFAYSGLLTVNACCTGFHLPRLSVAANPVCGGPFFVL
jgi:hypothetical protein